MRKLVTIFIFSLFSCFSFAQNEALPLQTATFDQMLAKSGALGKPFFVFFYLSDCGMSSSMFENTFQDPNFMQYANENYIGFRASGDDYSAKGLGIVQKFGVKTFPTILIFSPSGKLYQHIRGGLAGTLLQETLQTELQNMQNTDYEPSLAADYMASQNNAVATRGGFFEMEMKNVFMVGGCGSPTVATPAPEVPMTRGMSPKKEVAEREIEPEPAPVMEMGTYDAANYPDAHYGLQVAAYQNQQTAMCLAGTLEAEGETVVVKKVQKGAISQFRVIIAPSTSKLEAQNRKKAKSGKIGNHCTADAFVVSMEEDVIEPVNSARAIPAKSNCSCKAKTETVIR
jgi:hypothetical protein